MKSGTFHFIEPEDETIRVICTARKSVEKKLLNEEDDDLLLFEPDEKSRRFQKLIT